MVSKCYLFVVIFLVSLTATSQNLQSPSDFLGYELGTRFTRHHQVIDYYNYIAKHSSLVTYTDYGKTNEFRKLSIAFVSSEKNIAELEDIRKSHLSNIGLETSATTNDKAIVWLSYNVHGNEASSTEASMLTLYELITKKTDWLENTIVIIDPCLNPDGRDRYVNWYNQVANQPYNNNQHAREHQEPWPSGRSNHYLFDLNRDWAWATQVETQQRLKIYNKWLPHVHVDFHEQGINEPYYFAPAAEPFHEIITDWQRDFQTQIGKNHAQYFDQKGWFYFTRERFDLFYPSYGDTYPTYNGAIGMTYEQAGHGRAGLGIINDEGDELTLKDRIAHHTTTGLSTVEIASKNATKLNSEFKTYFTENNFKYKSYVLKGDVDKREQLINLLNKHDIDYGYASKGSVSGYNFSTGEKGNLKTDVNDIVISTNQPKGKMVKVLFEPEAKLSDSITYDITAWSVPYAYGFKAIASKKVIPSNQAIHDAQIFTATSNAYAYAFKWNHITDGKLLSLFLKAGFRVRFNEKHIESNKHQLNPGSLIITKGDNQHMNDFHSKIIDLAQQMNKPPMPLLSGFSDKGSDIGSPDVKEIKNQKIAILSGEDTSSLSFGEIQYYFEQELQYPYTALNSSNFSVNQLQKYHTLILPNGSYQSWLDQKKLRSLKSWIAKGGKIIAIGNACNAFSNEKDFGLTSKSDTNDKKAENQADVDTHLVAYNQAEREDIKDYITGAIFKTKVDTSHPLAFGYQKDYFSLKLSEDAFNYLENGYNVVRLEKAKVVSGFAGSNTLDNLNNSLVFGEQRIGQGSIIYMVDNPLFRAFWENGKLFFANALFMTNNNLKEL